MSRRAESTKHPAIATRRSVEDIESVEGSFPGWGRLSERQQAYLSAYAWCHDGVRAAELTGEGLDWVESQRKSGYFAEALAMILEKPREFARLAIDDMLPFSMKRLRDMIVQTENEALALQALKHLHVQAGLSPQVSSGIPQGQFLNIQVNMYDRDKPRVIEGDSQGV